MPWPRLQSLTHRGRRLGAYLWPAPVSLVGWGVAVVARCGGGRWRARQGTLEVTGGPLDRWLPRLGRQGADALTLGHVVLARSDRVLRQWRAHEHVHVRQFERWGMLMPLAYGLGSLLAWARGHCPYRDNPFERAAFDRHRQHQARRRAVRTQGRQAGASGKSRTSTP